MRRTISIMSLMFILFAIGHFTSGERSLAQNSTRTAPAPQSKDAVFFSAADLKTRADALIPQAKASSGHVASQNMFNNPTHYALLIHRDGPGEAEEHKGASDYWIVQSGEGTLVVGGEMEERRETTTGEFRGPSIKGGKTYKLSAGDQANIPPNIPHQILLEPGKSITYLVIKVNAG